eukprot:1161185-Pelagomonas_calceolata.AAC.5
MRREDQPLDVAAAATALTALQQQVNKHGTANASAANPYTAKSVDEVASGFITVANEAMCRPIRALTQMRGTDPDADVTFLRSCDMVPSKRVFDFYTVGRPVRALIQMWLLCCSFESSAEVLCRYSE